MYDVLVPVDLLFAYQSHENLPDLAGFDMALKNSIAVPLVTLPVVQMVNYIVKGKGDFEPYYQHCLASRLYHPSVSKTSFLREFRRRIRSLRWKPFTSRPTISAIENDCLIVQDGIELCCLSKARGKSWIKVSMPEEIYAKWLDRKTEVLNDVVTRTSRKVFYNPIDHPAYRKIKVARRDSIRLDHIRRLLGPIGQGLSGLDIGCNMGYMSHHLQRQGFRMTAIDYNDNHLAVAKALNGTYGLDTKFENCYFRQFQTDYQFDITLALTVLYHMFYKQENWNIPEYARMEKTAIVQKIDSLTRHALIWESGPDPDREIDLICSNSGLCHYYSLGSTKGTGKKRQLGVFLRPNTEISDYLRRRYTKNFK